MIDDKRTPKCTLIIEVALNVQFVHRSLLRFLAEKRVVIRCAVLQTELSQGTLTSFHPRDRDLATDSEVIA